MTDEDIINKYQKYKSIRKSKITDGEKLFLLNRFDNCNDAKEAIYRILNKIYTLPKCPYCDRYIKFFSWTYGYTKTCQNKKCIVKYKKEHTSFNDPITQAKVKESIKKKYGVVNIFNLPKVKEKCKLALQSTVTKEKRNKTILLKYGVDNVRKSSFIKEKIKKTIKERYGENPFNKGGKIYDKQTKTCLNKYGKVRYQNTEEFKQRLREISDISISKRKRTCVNLYGNATFNNQEKRNETMKINHSFNPISKTENLAYLYLSLEYPGIDRQYRDKLRYPFNCDFYIPSLDLFIECNFHWTHGKHPYNPDSKEDKLVLEQWKEKAKTSKYYLNAIETWTVRDVNKRKVAEENNINYKIFYSLQEVIEWLK